MPVTVRVRIPVVLDVVGPLEEPEDLEVPEGDDKADDGVDGAAVVKILLTAEDVVAA